MVEVGGWPPAPHYNGQDLIMIPCLWGWLQSLKMEGSRGPLTPVLEEGY